MPKKSPLYEYLKSTGVLETGDKDMIAEAKKQYRKQYLKNHKQHYRKSKKHIAVILEDHEQKVLEEQAKNHGLSLPQYIKQSALHYQAGLFLVPHTQVCLEIKEMVYGIYREIQEIQKKEKTKWFGTINNYDFLKEKVLLLESQTQQIFHKPISIIEKIHQEIQNNPQFKITLQEILKTHAP